MFKSVSSYFYERRQGLAKAAGFVGGAYLVGRYVLDRLEDIRERMMQERAARENVRKRFQQNMQDISFTIMAHLPILSKNVLTDMNVEALTAELQSMSRASKALPLLPPSSQPESSSHILVPPPLAPQSQSPSSPLIAPSESSLSSSLELVVPAPPSDTGTDRSASGPRSDSESISVLSQSGPMDASGSSWVDQFSERSKSHSRFSSSDDSASGPAPAEASSPPANWNPPSSNGPENNGEESVGTSSGSGVSSEAPSMSSSAILDLSASQQSDFTRSKAELWREVKMLTMTRTLTVLYSTALLSLFTHIQLSLLGRYKYVRSILELEADERAREQLDFETDISSLFFSAPPSSDSSAPSRHVPRNDSFSAFSRFGRIEVEHDHDIDEHGHGTGKAKWWVEEGIDEETERMYLMLSWWILNVGWKDVGERVRRGVEEVFEGISLKSKLGLMELHRLVGDVRRRVEHEVTFEGDERRINFLSTLLPPTSSALSHLLSRTGFPSPASTSSQFDPLISPFLSPEQNPIFNALLSETRDLLSSSDFLLVLEKCLDRGTDVLLDGLSKNVFSGGGAEESNLEGEPRMRLAGMLPGLARWSTLALNAMPNELVDNLADVREIEGFAAIIYSSYEDRFR